MKNGGCKGFVGERYDVREFFPGVLRENVVLGIQILFSTPNYRPRHLTWPRKDTEYRNSNALSIYSLRRTLSDPSRSRSPYTFQLISEKRCLTSGLLPSQVEGGRRSFARRNITSLGLAWSSGLSTSLRHRARKRVQDFNPVAGFVRYVGPSLCSSSPNPVHINGHIHAVDRFHGK